MSSSIIEQRWKLDRDRTTKMRELMIEYDATVYYPAKNALVEECAASEEGHFGGAYHDNGFGWSWMYCQKCGGRYDITGPNGETE
jgi:hypothetical protein